MKEALRPSVLASVDKTIMPIHCVRYTQGRSKEHHSNRDLLFENINVTLKRVGVKVV